VRDAVPVNAIVPAVGPSDAHAAVVRSGCRTAKVKVADHPESLADDVARVEAVRDALGPAGAVRVDANGAWDVDRAVAAVRALDRAAGGLEYVEQPCRTIDELAAVRRRVDVRIAADESIRRADDPLRVAVARAADVAVLKCTPLGGVARALRVAEAAALPCVVSSALETSVGLAAEVALAAALPELEFACGLDTLALLDGDLVADALRPVDGRLPVPRTPPIPEPALLDAHRQRDPERAGWWHDRLARTARHLGVTNL
jgi:O-succinylbenzoate synthase